MDALQTKIPKWVAVVIILIIIGFGVYAIIFMSTKKTGEEACFNFSDGTLQGWNIEQLYAVDLVKSESAEIEDYKDSKKKIFYEPFKLTSVNGEIIANTSSFQVPDSTIEHCLLYFASPDLSDNPDWQNICGFRYDITREYTSNTGDWYSYKVFTEIIIESETGDEIVLFDKVNPTERSFLTIQNFGVPYYYASKRDELNTTYSNYKVKQIRIGCIVMGYNFNPNTQFSGSWKLTNVCPVY